LCMRGHVKWHDPQTHKAPGLLQMGRSASSKHRRRANCVRKHLTLERRTTGGLMRALEGAPMPSAPAEGYEVAMLLFVTGRARHARRIRFWLEPSVRGLKRDGLRGDRRLLAWRGAANLRSTGVTRRLDNAHVQHTPRSERISRKDVRVPRGSTRSKRYERNNIRL
jgi:hypothetical protein